MIDFEKLKTRIADKGYNIRSLEHELSIANGTIGKWELQKTQNPRLDTIIKIANFLDCTVDDLLVKEPRYR